MKSLLYSFSITANSVLELLSSDQIEPSDKLQYLKCIWLSNGCMTTNSSHTNEIISVIKNASSYSKRATASEKTLEILTVDKNLVRAKSKVCLSPFSKDVTVPKGGNWFVAGNEYAQLIASLNGSGISSCDINLCHFGKSVGEIWKDNFSGEVLQPGEEEKLFYAYEMLGSASKTLAIVDRYIGSGQIRSNSRGKESGLYCLLSKSINSNDYEFSLKEVNVYTEGDDLISISNAFTELGKLLKTKGCDLYVHVIGRQAFPHDRYSVFGPNVRYALNLGVGHDAIDDYVFYRGTTVSIIEVDKVLQIIESIKNVAGYQCNKVT